MNLQLAVSPLMGGEEEDTLGSVEDRFIRIPECIRNEMGISIGTFLCFPGENGKPVVLQASKAFTTDTEDNNKVAYVSKTMFNLIKKQKANILAAPEDILVGCDPEFFIVDKITKRKVSANYFFTRWGELGNDVGMGEFRPRPSTSEDVLTNNLKELIVRATQRVRSQNNRFYSNPVDLMGFSYYDGGTAGFHIHFGLPKELLDYDNFHIEGLQRRMVQILDYYVGILSILPEGNDDVKRRSLLSVTYGKPSDYRADKITLEYRVPGGHLLRHPLLTKGLFAISIVVMKDLIARLKECTNNFINFQVLKRYDDLKLLYPNMLSSEEKYNIITSSDIKPAMQHMDKIFKDLSMMVGFKDRAQSIVNYFDYIITFLRTGNRYGAYITNNWLGV